jgi:hypothetical protein
MPEGLANGDATNRNQPSVRPEHPTAPRFLQRGERCTKTGTTGSARPGTILPDMRDGPSPSTLLLRTVIAYAVKRGTMQAHTPVGTVVEQNLHAH